MLASRAYAYAQSTRHISRLRVPRVLYHVVTNLTNVDDISSSVVNVKYGASLPVGNGSVSCKNDTNKNLDQRIPTQNRSSSKDRPTHHGSARAACVDVDTHKAQAGLIPPLTLP